MSLLHGTEIRLELSLSGFSFIVGFSKQHRIEASNAVLFYYVGIKYLKQKLRHQNLGFVKKNQRTLFVHITQTS